MIAPDRPKALQTYLLNQKSVLGTDRVGFLKVETGNGPAIVFNEGDWGDFDLGSNLGYEKGVDIFPILIDIVVKYEDYRKGYTIRNTIRKMIGKFNGKLTNDWEGNISFRQFLAPSYNHETNDIVFGSVYLLKQNYDYETTPTPTETETEILNNEEENNANDTD